jgi:uncharacterized membrane protein
MDATPTPVPAPAPAPPPPPAAPALATESEGKTIALVAYLTIIGFIIAIVMHNGKKSKIGAYHLRQVLGICVTGLALVPCFMILMFIPILGWIASALLAPICGICMFVLWLMGIIAAANGQMKPTPVLGPLYQKWFGTAFD